MYTLITGGKRQEFGAVWGSPLQSEDPVRGHSLRTGWPFWSKDSVEVKGLSSGCCSASLTFRFSPLISDSGFYYQQLEFVLQVARLEIEIVGLARCLAHKSACHVNSTILIFISRIHSGRTDLYMCMHANRGTHTHACIQAHTRK